MRENAMVDVYSRKRGFHAQLPSLKTLKVETRKLLEKRTI
jgi:hypothetical protein